MRGNYKLTAVKTRAVGKKIAQFYLKVGRKAVFGLVKKIQRTLLDFLRKIKICAFSVGLFANVFS